MHTRREIRKVVSPHQPPEKILKEKNCTWLIGRSKEESALYKFLNENKRKRVLDLGCAFPDSLLNIYHRFDYRQLLGIDNDNEKGCVKTFTSNIVEQGWKDRLETCDNFFDLYFELTEAEDDDEDLKPRITTREQFNKLMQEMLLLKTDIREFLRNSRDKWDFIIMSNVLHFYDDFTEIFESVIGKLNPGGIVYLRMEYADGRDYIKPEAIEKMALDHYDSGVLYETRDVIDRWMSSVFMNIEF